MTRTKALFAALAIFLLAGCSHQGPVKLYEGPKAAPDQLAVLVVPNALDVKTFDDKGMPYLFGNPEQREFHFHPGLHSLQLQYWKEWPAGGIEGDVLKSSPVTLVFQAEAGRTYEITPKLPKSYAAASQFVRSMRLDIRDKANGRIVSQMGTAAKTVLMQTAPPSESQPLEALKYWWGKATPDERDRFRTHIE